MTDVSAINVDDYLTEYSYQGTLAALQEQIDDYDESLVELGAGESSVDHDVKLYVGLSEKDAIDNARKRTKNLKGKLDRRTKAMSEEYVIKYPDRVLDMIHADMKLYPPPRGGAYSGFEKLQDDQMKLIRETQSVYNMGVIFRFNNSETGSGKTLMALAQMILSDCPNVLVCAPALARENWLQVFYMMPKVALFLVDQGYPNVNLPDRIMFISLEKLRQEDSSPTRLRTPEPEEAIIILDKYLSDVRSATDEEEYAPPKVEHFYMMTQQFQSFISEGCFVVIDESHKSKNAKTSTSHALGALCYPIVASKGGCQNFTYQYEQLRGWYPDADDYPDGMEVKFSRKNRGLSRILLMTSTVSDKNDKTGTARSCGLIFGAYDERDLMKSLIQDMLSTVRQNSLEYNEMVSPDKRFNFKVPKLKGKNQTVTELANWLIPKPLFNGAIPTVTNFEFLVTDYFGKLPDEDDEKLIAQYVGSIKNIDNGQAEVGTDKQKRSQYRIGVEAVITQLFIRTTESDIEKEKRVIISFRFLTNLAAVANYFIKSPFLKNLGLGPPLILTGSVKEKARPYIVGLFQHYGAKYRLLLGMEGIISESQSLHDMYGRETVFKSITAQNAVLSGQQKGRIKRIGVKSNTEAQTINAGLHYLIDFSNIKKIRELRDYTKLTPRQITNKVIELIIKIRASYFAKHGFPLNPQSDPGKKILIRTLTNLLQKQNPSLDLVVDVAKSIYIRYSKRTVDVQVSVGSSLVRRDEKGAILEAVTNELRELPKVTRFVEDHALASVYQPPPKDERGRS
jgi:hypothetical protein